MVRDMIRWAGIGSCLLMCALAAPAAASWPHSPGSPLPLIGGAKNDMVVDSAIPDGSGGAYVFWEGDNGAGTKNVYANHVLGVGVLDPAWPVAFGLGVPVCTAPGDQTGIQAIADNNGGLWVCWLDSRTATPHVYATRLLTDGTVSPAFPANGQMLDPSRTNAAHSPLITDDGGSGLIAVWEYDNAAGDHDIVGAHVSPAGTSDWAALLTSGPSNDFQPSLAREPGAFDIVFARSPSSVVFGRYSTGTGTLIGAPLTLSNNALNIERARVCPDGFGGAYALWLNRVDVSGQGLAVVRVLGGAVAATYPVPATSVSPLHIADLKYAGDNTAYGVYVGAGGVGVFPITRFEAGGSPALFGSVDPSNPGVFSSVDGTGGILPSFTTLGTTVPVRWGETLRFTAPGTPPPVGLWGEAPGGVITSLLPADAVVEAACTDGDGGTLVFSQLRGAGFTQQAYVTRVDRWGAFDGAAQITSVRDVPGDQGGAVRLAWSRSYLDVPGGTRIDHYDVWRQLPVAAAQARLAAGTAVRASEWVDGRDAGTLPRLLLVQRFGQSFAWEFVATSTAHGFANYSLAVPSPVDSGVAGPSTTAYMVEAVWDAQGVGWPSLPDSGHSVDNLPPATPQGFVAALLPLSGTTQLNWNANTEPDLAAYELYRGATTGFVPGPSNRVGRVTRTDYIDMSAGQYYKLAAIDVHGNRSGFALITPDGTLDTPSGTAPSELALALGSSNPARDGAVLRYELPARGRVTLAIFDVNGRVVRELSSGEIAAGRYTTQWDGRATNGATASSGMYFARLSHGGGERVVRLVLSR